MRYGRRTRAQTSDSKTLFPRKKKNKTTTTVSAAAAVAGSSFSSQIPTTFISHDSADDEEEEEEAKPRITGVPVARRTRSRFRNATTDSRPSSRPRAEAVLICLDSDDECMVESESGAEEERLLTPATSSDAAGIERERERGVAGSDDDASSEESGGSVKVGADVEVDGENRQEEVAESDDALEFKEKEVLKLDAVSDDSEIKEEDVLKSDDTYDDSWSKGSVSGCEKEDVALDVSSFKGGEQSNDEIGGFAVVKPVLDTEGGFGDRVSEPELRFEEDRVVVLDEEVTEGDARSNGDDHVDDKDAEDTNGPSSSCGKSSVPKIPPHNCVARRTRSKMWSLKSVDYSKYFHDPEESDNEEETLFSPSYSSSSSRERVKHKSDMGVRRTRVDAFYADESQSGTESSSDSDFEKEEIGEMEADMLKKGSMIGDDEEEVMRNLWMRNSARQKEKKASKDESLFNMFVNTMHKDEEDMIQADTGPSSQSKLTPQSLDPSNTAEELPLFFSFGDDDPKPVEKTEYEKAIDELWAEYDFVERLIDIGSYNNEEAEIEKFNVPEMEGHSTCCSEDEHFFILDEEIGILCKYCSFVALKIRNILPSFATRPGGICGRILPTDKESASILDDLCAKKRTEDLDSLLDPHGGTAWDLIPGIKNELYPHQLEGFEFIWKNIAGDIFLDKLKTPSSTDAIGGCVISHAPGTGKSRLTIVFLQSFMKLFPECRPVILAPRGMLLMWEKEFEKWRVDIPFHLLNAEEYNGKEDLAALKLVGTRKSQRWMRLVKLYSWNKGGSILGVSYGLFEKLVGQSFKPKTENEQISKILIERPGLFIFDEGHTPRNERSNIWKVLEKIKAERRIILSGTPFQNNFMELYNTFCLVRPKFAEKISRKRSNFSQKYFEREYGKVVFSERDEGRGNWASLTNSITDDSLEELRSIMSPFVHVHNGSILKQLPGKRECLVLLKPLPQQSKIIESIESMRADTLFGLEYKISLAAIHPSLLVACELSDKEKYVVNKHSLEELRLDPSFGIKTRFVMEIVRLSGSLNEKVLIFSQYIEPLALVKDQLLFLFGWTEGKEVLQMDGKFRLKQRQASIDHFNNPTSDVRVLLASTKACCEGITLTGASRVVLLDVVWNPSVEDQAISRAHRIGQTKVVYTYHLIAHGTREVQKYNRQIEKHQLSKLVFSAKGHDNMEDTPSDISDDKILDEMLHNEKLKDIVEEVLYQPRESNLMTRG